MRAPDLPPAVMDMLTRVFVTYPELTEVRLFGSRATGRATPRSDIDLATRGIVDDDRLGRLALDLEDLDIPQTCDLKAYDSIRSALLRHHIDTFGIPFTRSRIEDSAPLVLAAMYVDRNRIFTILSP